MLDDDGEDGVGGDVITGLAGCVRVANASYMSEKSKVESKVAPMVQGGVRSDDRLRISCPSGAPEELVVAIGLPSF